MNHIYATAIFAALLILTPVVMAWLKLVRRALERGNLTRVYWLMVFWYALFYGGYSAFHFYG